MVPSLYRNNHPSPLGRRLAAALVGLALLGAASLAPAQEPAASQGKPDGNKLVKASLVFDSSAAVPGEVLQVGLLMRMEDPYHVYWQYPGDSGEAPKVTWKLPPGVEVSGFRWPVPELHLDRAKNETYIYEHEVLLTATLTVPEDFAGEKLEIGADVTWLVCAASCYPGAAQLSASLPVAADLGEVEPSNVKLFMYWQQREPILTALSAMPLEDFTWAREGKNFHLTLKGVDLPEGSKLSFYPLPPVEWVLDHPGAPQVQDNGEVRITVPAFSAPEDAEEIAGLLVVDLPGENLGKGWSKRQAWVLTKLATSDLGRSDSAEDIANKLAAAEPRAPTGPQAGTEAGSTATPDPEAGSDSAAMTAAVPAAPGFLYALWLAFVGGLILNVMPCVLPAISLKIMGFIQDANEEPRKVALMGLAFTAGVFSFFMAFAAISVALTSAGQGLGWGTHFQYPIAVAGMAIVLVIFALNLFGLFEVSLPGQVMQKASGAAAHNGFGGAFLHGLLATVLATACTAPFMASALGFTLGQPAWFTFGVLGMLALGMSTPYIILALRPQWLRFLPRPGPWMESFKQFMGFLLLATVVWLLWVYQGVAGDDAVYWLLLALLTLCAGVWFWGVARPASRTAGGRRFATAMTALLLLASVAVLWQRGNLSGAPDRIAIAATAGGALAAEAALPDALDAEGNIHWMPWSTEAVERGLAEGRVVFIDFTARWCTNCIANKKLVLETPPIEQAFAERKVLALKADWTRRDEVTRAAINGYGRAGIPLNVVYGPGLGEGQYTILPEVLSQEAVLSALRAAAGPAAPVAAM